MRGSAEHAGPIFTTSRDRKNLTPSSERSETEHASWGGARGGGGGGGGGGGARGPGAGGRAA
ncbi:hypothetical protein, partial [Nocardia abscessus]|uniref:hypothetical protein n=1 Tax=Nocardia abscessus TaxID=120957 RepID=UPI00245434CC